MPIILAIDDKPDNLIAISALLKMTVPDVSVQTGLSGQEGIAKAKVLAMPDVILLDIVMPEMDGYEVCRRLRADTATQHIPIIMLTAVKTDAQSRIRGLQAGADAFLAKPVDEGELRAQINVMLRIRKAENMLLQERDSLDKQVRARTAELEKANSELHAELVLRIETEQKRLKADDRLCKALAWQEAIFEGSRDAVFVTDAQARFVTVNRRACELSGYAKDVLLGMRISDLHEAQVLNAYEHYRDRVMAGEEIATEAVFLRKDGTQLAAELSNSRVVIGDDIYIHTVVRDITERKKGEDALRASEEKYRRFYEEAPLGYQSLDASGNFLDVNKEWLRVLGYAKEEVIGRFFADFVAPEYLEAFAHNFPRFKTRGATRGTEFDMVRKDGTRITVAFNGNIEYDPEGRFRRTHCIMHDITERKRAEQELFENQAQLKSLASALVLAEERERSRIAIHLHDGVCQTLAFSKMKLQMAHAALGDQTQLDDMTEVCDSLTQVMQEVRSLTFELSTPVLSEFGLEAAVSQWLTEQIEQQHGITTTFTDDGQPKPLEDDIRALLFRSVRELLANVVKHSQARRVEVSMGREGDQILICLQDDGIGFAPEQVVVGKDTGGFGLFSIRERLSQMGGSLEIDSSPGRGCRSLLRSPLTVL